MYYIFFISFSVEGHLGSFQLLVIINKAAMNIEIGEELRTHGKKENFLNRIQIACALKSRTNKWDLKKKITKLP